MVSRISAKNICVLLVTVPLLIANIGLHAADLNQRDNYSGEAFRQSEDSSAIVVDFGRTWVQASMSGFLSSIAAEVPTDDQIAALKPRLIRGDPAQILVMDGRRAPGARYRMMRSLGARYTLVVSNVWGYPWRDFRGKGAPAQNLETFRALVGDLATQVRDRNVADSIIFDVWNEPNGKRFAPGTEADHLRVYLAAERTIHGILPDALVAGPSLTGFDPARIRRFLDFCLRSGCEVNVLTWHELLSVTSLPNDPGNDIADIADHIRTMRKLFFDVPRYARLKLQRIHINEYTGPKDQYRPGETIAYLSALERGGADAAVRSCWHRVHDLKEVSNCFNGSLDGVFEPEGKGVLAPWWVYSTYAAGVDHRASSTPGDPRLAVLAGLTTSPVREAQILIGHTRLLDRRKPKPAPVEIEVRNIDRVVPPDGHGRVHVLAKYIPDSGEERISRLKVIFDHQVNVSGDGAIRVALEKLPVHAAMIVSIFPTK